MKLPATTVLPLQRPEDIVTMRQRVRERAVALGLSLVDQTKVVTAASELGRNAILYGGGGRVELDEVHESGRRGLRLSFVDEGPGIADIQQALRDGYTSGTGLGLGLGGARRVSDVLTIDSAPGKGTRVTITRWR
jgi:serine/threonine-protein kinase RsbT